MVAILLHLYYQDLWEEFKEKLLPILSDTTHLYVTVNDENEYLEDIKKYAKEIYIVENKGMDIGPFIFAYSKIQHDNYKYVVKLHTKKSLIHEVNIPNLGENWRKNLVNCILKSPEHFSHIISYMNQNPEIYMGGSEIHFYNRAREPYNNPDRQDASKPIEKINKFLNVEDHGCFIAGSMFIVTTNYLNKLFKNIELSDFYNEFNEGYSRGGTLAHGFERVIGYGVESLNGKYLLL